MTAHDPVPPAWTADRAAAPAIAGDADDWRRAMEQLVIDVLRRARHGASPAAPAPPAGAAVTAGAAGAAGRGAIDRLSAREREVLDRIASGDSNKMIARALGVSPHTVKRHVSNLLGKLGARTRSQAAALARA